MINTLIEGHLFSFKARKFCTGNISSSILSSSILRYKGKYVRQVILSQFVEKSPDRHIMWHQLKLIIQRYIGGKLQAVLR